MNFPTLFQNPSGSPTLVCLPYFGGSARSFGALWPLLPASWGLRAYTMEGIGMENGVYSLDAAFEQLSLALRRDITGPFHLLGHSMGGKLALGMAALGVPNLESVLLVAPSPPSPEPMSDAARSGMVARHGTRAGALETVRLASHRPLPPELLEIAVEDDLATSETDWVNWLDVGASADYSTLLERVQVPLRIAVGARDDGMTARLMEETIIAPLRAFNGAQTPLEIIPDAGHLLPMEAPHELNDWLRAWVS